MKSMITINKNFRWIRSLPEDIQRKIRKIRSSLIIRWFASSLFACGILSTIPIMILILLLMFNYILSGSAFHILVYLLTAATLVQITAKRVLPDATYYIANAKAFRNILSEHDKTFRLITVSRGSVPFSFIPNRQKSQNIEQMYAVWLDKEQYTVTWDFIQKLLSSPRDKVTVYTFTVLGVKHAYIMSTTHD